MRKYNRAVRSLKSEEFQPKMELNQEEVLCPTIFKILMEDIIKEIKKEVKQKCNQYRENNKVIGREDIKTTLGIETLKYLV